MITPVNFPLAKLLKEKGFNEVAEKFYPKPKCKLFGIDEHGRYYKIINKTKLYAVGEAAVLKDENAYFAPTVGEVADWIYEKHGIWISVDWMTRTHPFYSGFICHLRGTNKQVNSDNFIVINNKTTPGYEVFHSPTEAYEAAILFCLEKI